MCLGLGETLQLDVLLEGLGGEVGINQEAI